MTSGGAAPAFGKFLNFPKDGADRTAGPAYSGLRSEAYDASGEPAHGETML